MSGLLDQLDERAEGALGVHEGNRRPARAGPGRFVDERPTPVSHGLECRGAILDPVPDVMQPLTPTLEEAGHR